MPKGVYDRTPKESQNMAPRDTAAQQMFPIVLNKNYVPIDNYEIIGYLKEAVKRKDAAGNWRVEEKEEFIEGVMKPHSSPGVGFGETKDKNGRKTNAKIWAGTHIRLPVEEAKRLIQNKAAERADAIPS